MNTIESLEQTIVKLREQRDNLLKFAMNAPVDSGVCCCGGSMEDEHHGDHNPVDQWTYSLFCFEKEFKEADNAKS